MAVILVTSARTRAIYGIGVIMLKYPMLLVVRAQQLEPHGQKLEELHDSAIRRHVMRTIILSIETCCALHSISR